MQLSVTFLCLSRSEMAPTVQKPLLKDSWCHNNDYVGGVTCWSSNCLYNIYKCKIEIPTDNTIYSAIDVFWNLLYHVLKTPFQDLCSKGKKGEKIDKFIAIFFQTTFSSKLAWPTVSDDCIIVFPSGQCEGSHRPCL